MKTNTKIIISFFMLYVLLGIVLLPHHKPKVVRVESYVVQAGDTLWTIAQQYQANTDNRNYIDQIRDLNDVTPLLQVGERLIIPIYEVRK